MNKRHFKLPDALRGLAALWVVLYHSAGGSRLDSLTSRLPGVVNLVVFDHGDLGVGVFFVTSGFVIAHSLNRGKSNPPNLARFMKRRLARLTPPYYAAIGLAIGFAGLASIADGSSFAVGGSGDTRAPLSLGRGLAHLIYSQEILGYENMNDVFWTLGLELQFYLAIGLVAVAHFKWVAPKLGSDSFTSLVGVVSAATLLWPTGIIMTTGRPTLMFSMFYSFWLGALVYWTWNRMVSSLILPVFVLSLLVGMIRVPSSAAFVGASLITGMVLLAASYRDGLGTWLAARPFVYLGRISYSLYLVHTPILGAVAVVVTKLGLGGAAGDLVGLMAGLAAALVASETMFRLVESPSVAWSRSIGVSAQPITAESELVGAASPRQPELVGG